MAGSCGGCCAGWGMMRSLCWMAIGGLECRECWQGGRYKKSGCRSRPARKFVPHVRPKWWRPWPRWRPRCKRVIGDWWMLVPKTASAAKMRRFTRGRDTFPAVCAFYANNLTPDARFQSPEFCAHALAHCSAASRPARQSSTAVRGSVPATTCWRGVAGLSGAKLYVGSWSEWSADPNRPIATT